MILSELIILPREDLTEGQLIIVYKSEATHIFLLVTTLSPLHPLYGETYSREFPDILSTEELSTIKTHLPKIVPSFNWTKTATGIMVILTNNKNDPHTPPPVELKQSVIMQLIHENNKLHKTYITARRNTNNLLQKLFPKSL